MLESGPTSRIRQLGDLQAPYTQASRPGLEKQSPIRREVDPTDIEAVHRWFTEVLPTLPPATIEEILEDLLQLDGTSDDKATARIYPKDAPLPSLSSSSPVPFPWHASSWREMLIRLTSRNEGS